MEIYNEVMSRLEKIKRNLAIIERDLTETLPMLEKWNESENTEDCINREIVVRFLKISLFENENATDDQLRRVLSYAHLLMEQHNQKQQKK